MNNPRSLSITGGLLLALLATAASAQSFGAPKSGGRSGTWEGYFGARALLSETTDFEGGSSIETDDDLGFGFGFAYNSTDRLQFGGEMSWSDVDYDGDIVRADSQGQARIDGEMSTLSLSGNATWHLIERPLTPYVRGTLGYTWVDTNIATGPPEVGCWWDPWWGYVCEDFTDTRDEEAYNYGVGLGRALAVRRSGLVHPLRLRGTLDRPRRSRTARRVSERFTWISAAASEAIGDSDAD